MAKLLSCVKSGRGMSLRFSDRHCKFPTKFWQTAANFWQKKIIGAQNFNSAFKFFQIVLAPEFAFLNENLPTRKYFPIILRQPKYPKLLVGNCLLPLLPNSYVNTLFVKLNGKNDFIEMLLLTIYFFQ